MVGAVVAAFVVTRSTSDPETSSVAQSASTSTTYPAPHPMGQAGTYPIYGMTPKQVARFTGRPMKVEGSCWLFRPTAGTQNGLPTRHVGTIVIGDPGSIAARSNGWVKLCFYENRFSEAHRQVQINGQLLWRPWDPGGPTVDACADPSACTPP